MTSAAPKGDRIPAPPSGFQLVGQGSPTPPPGFELVANEPQVDPEIAAAADQYEKSAGTGVFADMTGSGMANAVPFADEMYSAISALPNAAISAVQGKGFHPVDEYNRSQALSSELERRRRERHPIASTVGSIAGGLGATAPLSAGGLSFLNGAKPTVASMGGRAAAEGAAYGTVYGAGEGSGLYERALNAAKGFGAGAMTGGAFGTVAGSIASKLGKAVAPTADELASASQDLYRQSEQQGVRFAGNAITGLKNKLLYAAGQTNTKLRPKTAGTVEDVNRLFENGKDMSLEAFDEFRKGINLDLRTAEGSDKLQLTRMKQALNDFEGKVSPADMTGGDQGIPMLKEARKIWAQHKKAQTIETILDNADVKTGQYTQSGFANAIKTEMRGLYRAIQKGKEQGWTQEEIALIRQMAKGGSPSTLVNIFSKFAPRGVVSIGAGQLVGSGVPGVGNVAVPVLGHLAGKAADRGAMTAATTLRDAAAAGVSPKALPQSMNSLAKLFTDALSRGSGQQLPAYTSR